MKLKNKVALVTGSRRGIGKAIALEFAKQGAKIVVNDLHGDAKTNEVVEKIKSLGSEAIAIKTDVSKPEQVKAMVKQAIQKFGRIDILVNNAGIVIPKPYQDMSFEDWEKDLGVNLIGVFLCCQAVSPIMLKQKHGKIVNISSVVGITGSKTDIAYGAAKAGVIALTKSFAKELAPNVNVNCVAPGAVETDFIKAMSKERKAKVMEKIRLKRIGQPGDIAKAVLFLACDDSSFITGQTLVIDGGASLK